MPGMHACRHAFATHLDGLIFTQLQKKKKHAAKRLGRPSRIDLKRPLLHCAGSARHMLSGGISLCFLRLDVSLCFIELLLVTGLTFMTRSGANEMKRRTREEQVGEGVIARGEEPTRPFSSANTKAAARVFLHEQCNVPGMFAWCIL